MALTWDLLHCADHWNIAIRPFYIPGMINMEADELSRAKWSSDGLFIWAYPGFCSESGISQKKDLSTLGMVHLLPHYSMIHRHDPAAMALNAVHQIWSYNHLDAFLPPN